MEFTRNFVITSEVDRYLYSLKERPALTHQNPELPEMPQPGVPFESEEEAEAELLKEGLIEKGSKKAKSKLLKEIEQN